MVAYVITEETKGYTIRPFYYDNRGAFGPEKTYAFNTLAEARSFLPSLFTSREGNPRALTAAEKKAIFTERQKATHKGIA